MAKLNLRVRHEGGQGVVKGLDPEDSIEKLISHSLEVLGVGDADTGAVKMLSGFPPKPLDLSDRDRSIDSIGVRTGDTIIFQNINTSSSSSSSPSNSSNPCHSSSPSNSTTPNPKPETALRPLCSDGGQPESKRLKIDPKHEKLERKVVPADNSCLFTSINFCMSGEVVSSENSAFMREVCATVVRLDADKYSEAYLGRENEAYCEWIMRKDSWGGAIEVQILAEYLEVEIVVIDIISGSRTIFGECKGFDSRMCLIYDGIHYDPLYRRTENGSMKTLHSSKDDSVLHAALNTANEAHAAHAYTDTARFKLKCLVCGKRLEGEKEAQKHAQELKHTNFSEV